MKDRIFLLDDDLALAEEVVGLLEKHGYEVKHARTLAEAKSTWKEFQPDICLLDFKLPDGNGPELLDVIVSQRPDISVLMLSGYGTIPMAIDTIRKGAEDFLAKPLEPDHLLLRLKKLIEQRKLRNQCLQQDLNESGDSAIVGNSEALRKIIQIATTAASSDSTILITGESGTGKQLMAQMIHQKSPRKDNAFVYINCASLSQALLESDLFGHEKGAFTGAFKTKKGRVEIADRGTLFLDEIGEIPLELQAKLLHFLERGEYQRVGGTDIWKANIRLVCATNRNLQEEVRKGLFRQDLFYRINVIQLEMPSLRSRVDDIPVLVEHFIQRFARELAKPSLPVADGTMENLRNYSWPGNVRELQNAIERAMVLCRADRLTDSDFPFLNTLTDTGSELLRPRPLQDAINEFKAVYIGELLKQTGQNQSRAAEILQIQRTYLNRLIKELGIQK